MTAEEWRTAQHECGHAAAALCQALPVHLVTRRPGPGSLGRVLIPIEDLVEDREAARKAAILLLAGPGMADEPLPSWPLRPRMRGDDVHMLAIFCDRLGLDEAGYHGLCGEMWSLTTTKKFERLFLALTTWLERVPRMDRAMIAQAQTIAWR